MMRLIPFVLLLTACASTPPTESAPAESLPAENPPAELDGRDPYETLQTEPAPQDTTPSGSTATDGPTVSTAESPALDPTPFIGTMVTINDSLRAAATEVTVAQFALFMANTDYRIPRGCATFTNRQWNLQPDLGWGNPGFTQTDRHPVTCISAVDAQAYLDWLNDTLKPDRTYRLPTTDEWTLAATGTAKTAYPWGSTVKSDLANCSNSRCVDGFQYTSPVGRFTAYGGLYDVMGNVWEFTSSPSPDHRGMIFQMGGSYRSWSTTYFNVSFKNPVPMTERNNVSGFRVFQ